MNENSLASEKKLIKSVEEFIDIGRVLSFSDAVFAFAATLLVLKIDLPLVTNAQVTADLLPSLLSLWPQYLANLISFLAIGFYWLNHHTIFNHVKDLNRTLVWLNIIFLICLSFLPFPVDLFGDFSHSAPVIAFYSLSIAVVGFALTLVWSYAASHKLLNPDLSSRQVKLYTLELLLAPVVFLVSAPLAFIHPLISQLSWLFVIVGAMVIRRVTHQKQVG